MPREAPVTSAFLPSREQNAAELTDESASCARSRLSTVFTEIVLTPRSIRLTRPESTLPGPDLDERRRPAANELGGCLREAHGRR